MAAEDDWWVGGFEERREPREGGRKGVVGCGGGLWTRPGRGCDCETERAWDVDIALVLILVVVYY